MQLLLLLSIVCATFAFGDAQNATACSAARSEGAPCSGNVAPAQKFYYDSKMGVCQPFMYQGCGGNDNRFDTADKCRTTCANGAAQGGSAPSANATCPDGKAAFMVVKGVPAICRSSRDCQTGYGCFKGACCPNKAAICNLPYDTGHFGPGKLFYGPMFFYNPQYKACMLFTYYGYDGNANKFQTYNECVDFCV